MTVVDVNTGKFTGSGGNLEETVTKNNLEAAEEIVRQLRLRDIGGIIVVDFIDMVLESNRDLVLRRMVECLGRDRTRHQVAEVTSLGLVQMTRKRIGTGLLEAFSENVRALPGPRPARPRRARRAEEGRRRLPPRRRPAPGRRRGRAAARAPVAATETATVATAAATATATAGRTPSPKDVAAMARPAERPEATSRTGPARPPADEPRPAEPDDQCGGARRREPGPTATPSPVGTEPVDPVETPTGGARAEHPRPQPSSREADSAPATPAAPEPEKPKVVTRTRRRSASRPAGPPAAGEVPSLAAAGAPGGWANRARPGRPSPGRRPASP